MLMGKGFRVQGSGPMEEDADIRQDETLGELFGGRLRILQKKKGYRFSIDAVLLAHFARLKRGERAIDLGAGSAVISIILALRFPRSGRISGLELQGQLADMANRSVALNRLEERVEILQGDIRNLPSSLEGKSFDVAVFNPPYRRAGSGRINPNEERALARHEIRGAAADFLKASDRLLKDGGRVYLIYPAKRMVEILHRMRVLGLEPKKMRIAYSRASSEGDFVLVEGLKGGGEEVKILPPLFIYGEEGGYSREVQGIFNALPDHS
jgi:tRNA1(Val) A37 N6-methylase TrmN6